MHSCPPVPPPPLAVATGRRTTRPGRTAIGEENMGPSSRQEWNSPLSPRWVDAGGNFASNHGAGQCSGVRAPGREDGRESRVGEQAFPVGSHVLQEQVAEGQVGCGALLGKTAAGSGRVAAS